MKLAASMQRHRSPQQNDSDVHHYSCDMKLCDNDPVVQTAGVSDPYKLVLVAQIKLISTMLLAPLTCHRHLCLLMVWTACVYVWLFPFTTKNWQFSFHLKAHNVPTADQLNTSSPLEITGWPLWKRRGRMTDRGQLAGRKNSLMFFPGGKWNISSEQEGVGPGRALIPPRCWSENYTTSIYSWGAFNRRPKVLHCTRPEGENLQKWPHLAWILGLLNHESVLF